jgi:DNA-directed RNA polymerase subunit RPC12/RpoP
MGRPQTRTKSQTICAHCGATFEHWSDRDRKFCTDSCAQYRVRKTKSTKNLQRICHTCGKHFQILQETRITKNGLMQGHGKYCSRECKWNDSEIRKKPPVLKQHSCIVCDKIFEPSKKSQKKCSRECRLRFRRNAQKIPKEEIACGNCGKAFLASARTQRFCSRQCMPSYINQPRHVKNKAENYGVSYDPKVTRLKVFERDNWCCQICEIDTPKEKMGSFSDDAPEMDHIVALSKGGSHSWENVQCLCRFCNGAKRNYDNNTFAEARKMFGYDNKVDFIQAWKCLHSINIEKGE